VAKHLSILVLYGSQREESNAKKLTQAVLEGIPHHAIDLRDHTIRPIDDHRHDPRGFLPVDDDYDTVIQEVLRHDILIFSLPIYWYGIPGRMKNFIDRWSVSLRDSRFDFKEIMRRKTAYVIAVGGDNPRIKGLPLIQQFQYIFDFVGMTFGGYIIGQANRPGEIEKDLRALAEAEQLNRILGQSGEA